MKSKIIEKPMICSWKMMERKKYLTLAVVAIFIIAPCIVKAVEVVLAPETHNIVTVTGISYDPIGDNGPATSAQFNEPRGIAFDSLGSLYIADGFNHRIRRVDTNGLITTVAGTGISGFSGDGGPATEAQLAGPFGIAFDSSDNIYIAERLNNRIRKVDTNGIITTIAGTGVAGFNGDNQPATSAQLNGPFEVTIDDSSGNLYIADTDNNRIRFVNLTSNPVPLPGHPEQTVDPGIITTIAGTGIVGFNGDNQPATSAQLSNPRRVAFDSSGNYYFVDLGNERIRKVDTNGIITTVVGNGTRGFSGDGGAATSAQINRPRVVTIDSSDNLYIADFFNNRVRKVTRSPDSPLGDGNIDGDADEIIMSIAGTGMGGFSGDGGPAIAAQFNNPLGVTFDSSGNLYISDNRNNRIRKVTRSPDPPLGDGNIDGDADEIITTFAGGGIFFGGDGGPATLAQLNNPYDVASDSSGNLYLADSFNNRIRKIDTNGIITTVVGTGDAGSSGDGGPATAAQLNGPQGVTFDSSDNLYLSDTGNHCVRKVDTHGIITTVAGTTGVAGISGDGGPATAALLTQPRNVAFDSLGNMYIAVYNSAKVRFVNLTSIQVTLPGQTIPVQPGNITTFAGIGSVGFSGDGGLATLARLNTPFDIAVDSSDNVYITDRLNNRIRKVDTNGIITTIAGTGIVGFNGDNQPATSAQLSNPRGINFDSSGNLYIADNVGHRVRKVDTMGIITTVAGTGIGGFAGDGGPATSAQINGPSGMLLDDADNLYLADTDNARVRRLNVSAVVDINPHTLNINSSGKWVTAYIQFSAGRDASGVNLDSVILQAIDPTNGAVRSVSNQELKVMRAPNSPAEFFDTNDDDVSDKLMVKFDLETVASWPAGTQKFVVRVEGQFQTGEYFSGDTQVQVK